MKRSYLEITVHWINSTTLKRELAALTSRRMTGKHTYDILAKTINTVFLEYHIQNKVCCITTDSGSNFIKAFQIFEKDKESEIEFYNISDILLTGEENSNNTDPIDAITFPSHHRCVSHLLNLIAVKDSKKTFGYISRAAKAHRITRS